MRFRRSRLRYPQLLLVGPRVERVCWVEFPDELGGSEVVLKGFGRVDGVEEFGDVFPRVGEDDLGTSRLRIEIQERGGKGQLQS